MNELELLCYVRDGLVHRSRDGKTWLRLGQHITDVTGLAEVLLSRSVVWSDRNAQGWHALLRLTSAGECLVGVRATYVRREPTAQDAELAARLYRANESIRKIARTLQMSDKRVRELLADEGVKLRAPGRPTREDAPR